VPGGGVIQIRNKQGAHKIQTRNTIHEEKRNKTKTGYIQDRKELQSLT
jgi:hypothetical protein